MMEHLRDITIIEFTAGNLKADEAKEVQRHISDCHKCSARVLDFQRQWDSLGQWEDVAIGEDMAADMCLRVNKHITAAHTRFKGVWIILHSFAVKAAAIVVIGAMLGFFAASRDEGGHLHDGQGIVMPEFMESLSLAYSTEMTWAAMETGFEYRGDE